jgi:hypothetical protein
LSFIEADRQLQDRIEQFQQPGGPIRISRLISTNSLDNRPATTKDTS